MFKLHINKWNVNLLLPYMSSTLHVHLSGLRLLGKAGPKMREYWWGSVLNCSSHVSLKVDRKVHI